MEEINKKHLIQTIPPSQPVKPNSKLPRPHTLRHHHSIVAIIILVLVICLGMSGFFLDTQIVHAPTTKVAATFPKPTTDPTAKWKTFTNSSFGYMFKYPATWEVKNDQSSNDTEVQYHITHCPTNIKPLTCDYSEIIDITAHANPNNYSIPQFFAQYEPGVSGVTFSPYLIDNMQAERSTNIPGEFESDTLFIKHTNYIYEVNYVKNGGNKIPPTQFTLFLSTFHFTGQDQSTDTSTWKTYDQSRIYFKYPTTWFLGQATGEGGLSGQYLKIPISNYPFDQVFGSSHSNQADYVVIGLSLTTSSSGKDAFYSFLNSLSVGEKKLTQSQTDYVTREADSSYNNTVYIRYTSYPKESNQMYELGAEHYENKTVINLMLQAQNKMALEKNRAIFNQILYTLKFTH